MKEEFICKTDIIKKRNWTDSLIKKYLPEPDLYKPNPNYRSGSPMRIYLTQRVIDIEKCAQFQIDFQKSLKRKQRSNEVIQVRKQNLMNEVKHAEIRVKRLDYRTLLRLSIKHYNSWNFMRNYIVQDEIDEKTKNRLMVNYLRHQMTSYDSILSELYSKVGKTDAYELLNRRVYDVIGNKYPALKDECMNQMERKFKGYVTK
jgi:hypothetical protein